MMLTLNAGLKRVLKTELTIKAKRKCKAQSFVCTLFVLTLTSVAWADADDSPWSYDLDVTGSSDNNVGRAAFERDRVSEFIVSSTLGLNYDFDLGLLQGLSTRAFAEGEAHETVKGLNTVNLGAEVIYRWQFALGFYEPFFQISGRVSDQNAQGQQRDATNTALSIQGTRRLSDHFALSLGYELRRSDSEAHVFDIKTRRAFANLDYRIDSNWLMYGTYGYTRGQFVSTAQRQFCNGALATDIYPLIQASDGALDNDEAFNNSLCGQWLAYRLDGTTQTFTLGLNRGLSHESSMDLSVLWVDTRVPTEDDGDIDYQRRIVRVSFLTRF